jgi:hypothetical protein
MVQRIEKLSAKLNFALLMRPVRHEPLGDRQVQVGLRRTINQSSCTIPKSRSDAIIGADVRSNFRAGWLPASQSVAIVVDDSFRSNNGRSAAFSSIN